MLRRSGPMIALVLGLLVLTGPTVAEQEDDLFSGVLQEFQEWNDSREPTGCTRKAAGGIDPAAPV